MRHIDPVCAFNFQDVPRVRELQELQAVLREAPSHHDPAPPEAVGRVQEVLRRRGDGGDAEATERRGGGEGTQAGHGVLILGAFLTLSKKLKLKDRSWFYLFDIFFCASPANHIAVSAFSAIISVLHTFVFAFALPRSQLPQFLHYSQPRSAFYFAKMDL